MSGVSFLLCVCIFNEASHAEADGGAILDSAGSAAQSLLCKSCKFTAQQTRMDYFGTLNFPICNFY